MMDRNRWWAVLVTTAMFLAACSSSQPTMPIAPGHLASTDHQAAAPAAAASWPVTLQDDEGRTVTIPAEPLRIISLAPSNTEILFALGLGDRLQGVDAFSDYPPAATAKSRVGDLMNPNHELLLGLKPDLVLAIGGSQKFWERVAAQGVPVFVVQPKTLMDVISSVERVGQLTGATVAATKLAAELRARVDRVRRQVSVASGRPKVFYEVWHEPLMSAGPGSFVNDLVELAGGENVAKDAKSPWPEVSLESVLAANPDVILSGDVKWVTQLQSGEAKQWQQSPAVRNQRVRALDPNLITRPGPRMVAGLEQMAAVLHPDAKLGKTP